MQRLTRRVSVVRMTNRRSQVSIIEFGVSDHRSQVPGPVFRILVLDPSRRTSRISTSAGLHLPPPFPRVATSCIRSLQFRDPIVARVSGAHYRVLSPWSRVHGSRVAGDGRSLTEASSSSSSSRSRRLRDKSTRRRRPPDGFDTQRPAEQWRRHTRSVRACCRTFRLSPAALFASFSKVRMSHISSA